nr:HAMP domain-containing sensor histidine kinase [Pseudoclavibacter chungangensis]
MAATRSVPPRTLPTVYPWSGEQQLVAEPFATGSSGALGAVVLAVDLSTARADVTQRWVLVGLVGVLLLAVLLAASLAWTNWVLRPVRALDAAANALAEQRNPRLHPPTGPRELRRLSASFARMSRAVEEALEQQRGFVAEASHQLRNPLAAIRLRFDAGQVADDGFDAIAHDVDRLEHVVDRMLVLANAEHRATAEASAKGAGFAEGASHEHTTSAADLVGASVRRLAAGGIELRVAPSDPTRADLPRQDADIDDIAGPVESDTTADARAHAPISLACRRSDLEEIVEILLDNAREYAGEGARVTLDVRAEGPHAVLEIADDGPGLGPEDLAHLGTRFWRAPEHRSRPGTGLGLAIVGQLARANGGDVTYDRAVAGGLRVRVRFERIT